MLTSSIYNHLFKRDNHCYLFNSRNSFFAEIPEELYEIIDNNDLRQLDENTLCELTDKGIVTKSHNTISTMKKKSDSFQERTIKKRWY